MALEAADEERHEQAEGTLAKLVAGGVQLVTTNFIFDETYTLLLARLGRAAAVAWGERQLESAAIVLVRVTESNERRAWEIVKSFADKDFSYTDATSFAVAEYLGIDSAFAFDQHFVQHGRLRVVPESA
jgi:predicted nucleic acid-binding protein